MATLAVSALAAAQSPPAPQRPRFGVSVPRVLVDVIVTDSDGRFIDDLKPEDFVIFEDGEPQRVAQAQLVDLIGGAVVDLAAPTGGAPSNDAIAAPPDIVVPPGADPRAAETVSATPASDTSDLGAMVFLIDYPGLDWRTKSRFAQAWEELTAETESLGVPRAAYMIDQQHRLVELTPLTMSPDRLREAAEQVIETPVARRSMRDHILMLSEREWPDLAHEERMRSLYTLEVLERLADVLAHRGGRTALVWVSSGILLEDLEPGTAGGTGVDVNLYLVDAIILARQEEMHRAANSARVSIYTVDPSGLTDRASSVGSAGDASIPAGRMPAGMGIVRGDFRSVRSLGRQREQVAGFRDPLVMAAGETGGKAFIGWSDIGKALRDIEQDMSRYYLLTYEPPPPHNDGEYHEIRVEVRRRDTSVRARSGYVDHAEGEQRIRRVNAALSNPSMVAELALVAEIYPTVPVPGEANVVFAVEIGTSGLGLIYEDSGAATTSLEVRAAAFDDDGEVIAEMVDHVREPIASDPTGRPAAESITRRYGWTIEPGTYDVRIMVFDEISGRLGATRLDVEVPR